MSLGALEQRGALVGNGNDLKKETRRGLRVAVSGHQELGGSTGALRRSMGSHVHTGTDAEQQGRWWDALAVPARAGRAGGFKMLELWEGICGALTRTCTYIHAYLKGLGRYRPGLADQAQHLGIRARETQDDGGKGALQAQSRHSLP